ncbi:MAG: hypothetical protein IJU31_06910 [Synergistaceae bacterium]|nr:hypothetical protein [Synergistaceae bacterium]
MNEFIGMDWEELQNEIFTSDEIEASRMRIAPIVSEIQSKASCDFLKDMTLNAMRVAVL